MNTKSTAHETPHDITRTTFVPARKYGTKFRNNLERQSIPEEADRDGPVERKGIHSSKVGA